ncbi:hypothetical protein J4573_51355 [Actinomadura barringtoniae]|uniref:Uncharacterized protein n=1 Tax=Actinomadura barringtoniae TaxID=1427535 RepID=A0A939PV31_9ACTN|nr:hypothetical protein [Actinomadura barringtoniae]MBO2455554.1 hypothetical protein [Actinomadura barringtoniae]
MTSEPIDAVPESVRAAVESVRAELWRDHAVRSAERAVAEQWLQHLRSRLRFAFEEWQAVRRERDAFQRELEEARAAKDRRRVAAIEPMANQASVNDLEARRRYRVVANSVVVEMCRIREVIVQMNRNYLAQIRDLRTAIDTVDAALGLPLPPVTRPPEPDD